MGKYKTKTKEDYDLLYTVNVENISLLLLIILSSNLLTLGDGPTNPQNRKGKQEEELYCNRN